MKATVFFLLVSLVAVAEAQQPRIFVTDSQSWESKGGARGQTAEIVKTFKQRCPELIANNRAGMADYVVVFDHEGGKWIRKDNKVAVFNKEGDSVFSESTRSLGNSVQGACGAIRADWSRNPTVASTSPASTSTERAPSSSPTSSGGNLGLSVVSDLSGGGADGVRVMAVLPSSPAAKAGVAVGDVILEVNGKTVRDRLGYEAEIGKCAKGSRVNLSYKYRGTTAMSKSQASEQHRGLLSS